VLSFEAPHALVSLVIEPGLRQKDRKQSEQDRKADHDDGTGTHVRPLMTPKFGFWFSSLFAAIIGLSKCGIGETT
jgi:hypothetical protein